MSHLSVCENQVVSFEYIVRLENGEILDSSEMNGPFEYLHGYGGVIPGLEKQLNGMKVGESKSFVVPPADAYGEYDDEAVEWLPVSLFPPDELQPGAVFELEDESGEVAAVYIREMGDGVASDGDDVLVDYNHPLAGETLHFEVTVKGVRPATKVEIAHEHVHHGDDHH